MMKIKFFKPRLLLIYFLIICAMISFLMALLITSKFAPFHLILKHEGTQIQCPDDNDLKAQELLNDKAHKLHLIEDRKELINTILAKENISKDHHQTQIEVTQNCDFTKSEPNYLINCTLKKNIVFLKTHKCGSTTVQNIFLRFGDVHDLTFVLPHTANYLGHPTLFNRRLVPKPSQLLRDSYNILTHHTRFYYPEIAALMPQNTVYITILRDPVELFESLYVYYDLRNFYGKSISLKNFIKSVAIEPDSERTTNLTNGDTLTNTLKFINHAWQSIKNWGSINSDKRYLKKFGRNQMSFDLGLEIKHFEDQREIEMFINKLDEIFSLVMIAERMDESLILLKNLLCWNYCDVIAFKHNARASRYNLNITADMKNRIRSLNRADQMLYDHFKSKFDANVEAFGKDRMLQELDLLRSVRSKFYKKCVDKEEMMNRVVPKTFHPNHKVLAMKPKINSDKICFKLTIPEILYTEILRKKQFKFYRKSSINKLSKLRKRRI